MWVVKVQNMLAGKKKETDVEGNATKAKKRVTSLGGAVSTVLQLAFVAVVFIISTAYLVDATYNPFLYFRF